MQNKTKDISKINKENLYTIEENNLIKKYEKTPIYCDIYTLGNVKVVLTDFGCEFLKLRNFTQNIQFDNIKIIIGLISGIFSITITYMSMIYKWASISLYIKLMVIGYYIINSLWYLIDYFEDGKFIFFDGTTYLKVKIGLDIHGIYTITYNNKNYKINAFDIIYENGKLDIPIIIKELNKIFY